MFLRVLKFMYMKCLGQYLGYGKHLIIVIITIIVLMITTFYIVYDCPKEDPSRQQPLLCSLFFSSLSKNTS